MSLVRSTVFTFINKLAVSMLGFLNSVLLARFNSNLSYGIYQTSASLNSVPTTFLGGYTGFYAYALAKDEGDALAITQMGNLFVFCLGGIFLAGVAALKLFAGVHFSPTVWWACLCMPVSVLFNYGTKLLQGLNEVNWLNRANILQPAVLLVISTLLILNAGHWSEPVRLRFTYLAWIGSFALAAIATLWIAFKLTRKRHAWKWAVHAQTWKGMLRYGSWLSISNAVNIVNYRIDFWFVASLWPTHASEYAIAVTASEVLLQVSGSISIVVFRRMTSGTRADAIRITQLSVRHTLISSLIATIPMYLLFPSLIHIAYGSRYGGAVTPFLILLPGLVVKAAGNVLIQYATNQLGRPQIAIWMNGMCAAINAIGCLVLVPTMQITGAAVASTVSYLCAFIVYTIWFSKINKIRAAELLVIRRSDIIPYYTAVKRVLIWR